MIPYLWIPILNVQPWNKKISVQFQRQRQQLLKQQEVDKQKTEQQRKSAASLNGDPAQSPASVIKSQPQEPRESHSKLPKKSKKSKSIKKDKNRKEGKINHDQVPSFS